MTMRKHALLFFSKAPEAGVTKTRLTAEQGGLLTPQEAADLYHQLMLDTAEVGMRALEQLNREGGAQDRYDFVVCTTPRKNLARMQEVFEAAGPWPLPITYIVDEGANFNEHFDHGFKQLWDMGYESAVSIGGDLPQMTISNLTESFRWLREFQEKQGKPGLVLCPCQACGVSLVGMSRDTPVNFAGVFYNTDGVSALDAIINTAREKDFPVAALETVADVDTVEDFAHALSLAHSQEYTCRYQAEVVVPKRFIAWAEREGYQVCTPPNENHDPRRLIDA